MLGGRALLLEKARGPSAAASEGERGTQMKGGVGARNPILGNHNKSSGGREKGK